jgi:hypothetical protein
MLRVLRSILSLFLVLALVAESVPPPAWAGADPSRVRLLAPAAKFVSRSDQVLFEGQALTVRALFARHAPIAFSNLLKRYEPEWTQGDEKPISEPLLSNTSWNAILQFGIGLAAAAFGAHCTPLLLIAATTGSPQTPLVVRHARNQARKYYGERKAYGARLTDMGDQIASSYLKYCDLARDEIASHQSTGNGSKPIRARFDPIPVIEAAAHLILREPDQDSPQAKSLKGIDSKLPQITDRVNAILGLSYEPRQSAQTQRLSIFRRNIANHIEAQAQTTDDLHEILLAIATKAVLLKKAVSNRDQVNTAILYRSLCEVDARLLALSALPKLGAAIQDEAMRLVEPEIYKTVSISIQKKLRMDRQEAKEHLNQLLERLKSKIKGEVSSAGEAPLGGVLFGRVKSVYSTYRKLLRYQKRKFPGEPPLTIPLSMAARDFQKIVDAFLLEPEDPEDELVDSLGFTWILEKPGDFKEALNQLVKSGEFTGLLPHQILDLLKPIKTFRGFWLALVNETRDRRDKAHKIKYEIHVFLSPEEYHRYLYEGPDRHLSYKSEMETGERLDLPFIDIDETDPCANFRKLHQAVQPWVYFWTPLPDEMGPPYTLCRIPHVDQPKGGNVADAMAATGYPDAARISNVVATVSPFGYHPLDVETKRWHRTGSNNVRDANWLLRTGDLAVFAMQENRQSNEMVLQTSAFCRTALLVPGFRIPSEHEAERAILNHFSESWRLSFAISRPRVSQNYRDDVLSEVAKDNGLTSAAELSQVLAADYGNYKLLKEDSNRLWAQVDFYTRHKGNELFETNGIRMVVGDLPPEYQSVALSYGLSDTSQLVYAVGAHVLSMIEIKNRRDKLNSRLEKSVSSTQRREGKTVQTVEYSLKVADSPESETSFDLGRWLQDILTVTGLVGPKQFLEKPACQFNRISKFYGLWKVHFSITATAEEIARLDQYLERFVQAFGLRKIPDPTSIPADLTVAFSQTDPLSIPVAMAAILDTCRDHAVNIQQFPTVTVNERRGFRIQWSIRLPRKISGLQLQKDLSKKITYSTVNVEVDRKKQSRSNPSRLTAQERSEGGSWAGWVAIGAGLISLLTLAPSIGATHSVASTVAWFAFQFAMAVWVFCDFQRFLDLAERWHENAHVWIARKWVDKGARFEAHHGGWRVVGSDGTPIKHPLVALAGPVGSLALVGLTTLAAAILVVLTFCLDSPILLLFAAPALLTRLAAVGGDSGRFVRADRGALTNAIRYMKLAPTIPESDAHEMAIRKTRDMSDNSRQQWGANLTAISNGRAELDLQSVPPAPGLWQVIIVPNDEAVALFESGEPPLWWHDLENRKIFIKESLLMHPDAEVRNHTLDFALFESRSLWRSLFRKRWDPRNAICIRLLEEWGWRIYLWRRCRSLTQFPPLGLDAIKEGRVFDSADSHLLGIAYEHGESLHAGRLEYPWGVNAWGHATRAALTGSRMGARTETITAELLTPWKRLPGATAPEKIDPFVDILLEGIVELSAMPFENTNQSSKSAYSVHDFTEHVIERAYAIAERLSPRLNGDRERNIEDIAGELLKLKIILDYRDISTLSQRPDSPLLADVARRLENISIPLADRLGHPVLASLMRDEIMRRLARADHDLAHEAHEAALDLRHMEVRHLLSDVQSRIETIFTQQLNFRREMFRAENYEMGHADEWLGAKDFDDPSKAIAQQKDLLKVNVIIQNPSDFAGVESILPARLVDAGIGLAAVPEGARPMVGADGTNACARFLLEFVHPQQPGRKVLVELNVTTEAYYRDPRSQRLVGAGYQTPLWQLNYTRSHPEQRLGLPDPLLTGDAPQDARNKRVAREEFVNPLCMTTPEAFHWNSESRDGYIDSAAGWAVVKLHRGPPKADGSPRPLPIGADLVFHPMVGGTPEQMPEIYCGKLLESMDPAHPGRFRIAEVRKFEPTEEIEPGMVFFVGPTKTALDESARETLHGQAKSPVAKIALSKMDEGEWRTVANAGRGILNARFGNIDDPNFAQDIFKPVMRRLGFTDPEVFLAAIGFATENPTGGGLRIRELSNAWKEKDFANRYGKNESPYVQLLVSFDRWVDRHFIGTQWSESDRTDQSLTLEVEIDEDQVGIGDEMLKRVTDLGLLVDEFSSQNTETGITLKIVVGRPDISPYEWKVQTDQVIADLRSFHRARRLRPPAKGGLRYEMEVKFEPETVKVPGINRKVTEAFSAMGVNLEDVRTEGDVLRLVVVSPPDLDEKIPEEVLGQKIRDNLGDALRSVSKPRRAKLTEATAVASRQMIRNQVRYLMLEDFHYILPFDPKDDRADYLKGEKAAGFVDYNFLDLLGRLHSIACQYHGYLGPKDPRDNDWVRKKKRENEAPYMIHPDSVAHRGLRANRDPVKALALLAHDLLEDGPDQVVGLADDLITRLRGKDPESDYVFAHFLQRFPDPDLAAEMRARIRSGGELSSETRRRLREFARQEIETRIREEFPEAVWKDLLKYVDILTFKGGDYGEYIRKIAHAGLLSVKFYDTENNLLDQRPKSILKTIAYLLLYLERDRPSENGFTQARLDLFATLVKKAVLPIERFRDEPEWPDSARVEESIRSFLQATAYNLSLGLGNEVSQPELAEFRAFLGQLADLAHARQAAKKETPPKNPTSAQEGWITIFSLLGGVTALILQKSWSVHHFVAVLLWTAMFLLLHEIGHFVLGGRNPRLEGKGFKEKALNWLLHGVQFDPPEGSRARRALFYLLPGAIQLIAGGVAFFLLHDPFWRAVAVANIVQGLTLLCGDRKGWRDFWAIVKSGLVAAVRRAHRRAKPFGDDVDYTLRGTFVYPAPGSDVQFVADLMRIFPNMEGADFVDRNYLNPGQLDTGSAFYDGLPETPDERREMMAGHLEDARRQLHGTILSKNVGEDRGSVSLRLEDGRQFEVRLRSAEYAQYRPDEPHAVSIVKFPGQGGEMAQNVEFWKQIVNQTRPGGYIIVRDADFPSFISDFLESWGLRLVHSPRSFNLSRLHQNRSPSALYDIDEPIVLQKVVPAVRKHHTQVDSVSWKELDPEFVKQMNGNEHQFDKKIFWQILQADPEVLDDLMRRFPEKVYINPAERGKPIEGRTVYMSLDTPMTIQGKTVNELRIKGIRPRVVNGIVQRYPEGTIGDTEFVIEPQADGTFGKCPFPVPPHGSMTGPIAKRERDTLRALSDRTTGAGDVLLGWGELKGRIFPENGKPVEFIVAGMEAPDDRLYLMTVPGGLAIIDRKTGNQQKLSIEESGEVIKGLAWTLRHRWHAAGIYHQDVWWSNVGLQRLPNGKFDVILRDYEVSREKGMFAKGISKEQEAALRLLDLQRMQRDLINIGLGHLAEKFLRAYFEDGIKKEWLDKATSLEQQVVQCHVWASFKDGESTKLKVGPRTAGLGPIWECLLAISQEYKPPTNRITRTWMNFKYLIREAISSLKNSLWQATRLRRSA